MARWGREGVALLACILLLVSLSIIDMSWVNWGRVCGMRLLW